MSANSEMRWIKIGKYTINLDAVRFIVEHYNEDAPGEGSKCWLEVWCLGETKPVILLHGDQATALKRYLAFPKRVEDLSPVDDQVAPEVEEPSEAREWPPS
jgi:hypothetical protein